MKKIAKSLGALTLAAALFFSTAACNNQPAGSTTPPQSNPPAQNTEQANEPDSNQTQTHEPITLRVAGGNTTGTGYAYWLAVANLMSQYSDFVSLELVESTGSPDTLNFVMAGEADLGIVAANSLIHRYDGSDGIEGGQDLRAVIDLYSSYVQIVCPADTDMNTWSDLSGHKFNLNVVNNVGNEIGNAIIESLGLTGVETFGVSNSDAVDMISEGNLDAHIIVVGLDNSTVMQVAASPRGLKTLTCTDKEAEKVRAVMPILGRGTLPAGNAGLDYEVPTLTSSTSMIARADVPEDAVYEICRIVFEHHDELAAACAVASETVVEMTVSTFGSEELIPFHPAAKQYLQDVNALS